MRNSVQQMIFEHPPPTPPRWTCTSSTLLSLYFSFSPLSSSAVKLRVHHTVTTWRPHQSCIHRPRGLFQYHSLKYHHHTQLEFGIGMTWTMTHYPKCPHADTLSGRARAGDGDAAASSATASRDLIQPTKLVAIPWHRHHFQNFQNKVCLFG